MFSGQSLYPLGSIAVALLLAACSGGPGAPRDASPDQGRRDAPSADRAAGAEARADRPVTPDQLGLDRAMAADKGRADLAVKPDGGSCKPYCGAIGSKSEGWFDGCTHAPLQQPGGGGTYWDQCAKCEAECASVGTPKQGWYKVCDSKLLRWQLCASSKADAGAGCRPYCGAIGSWSEGWYDGCTNQLLDDPIGGGPMWAQCATCFVACKAIGSFSEGWYAECPGDLILLGGCSP